MHTRVFTDMQMRFVARCIAFSLQSREALQVIIDVRNVYETSIGHFDPRAHVSSLRAAAELVDPKMRQSTDFPGWLHVSG